MASVLLVAIPVFLIVFGCVCCWALCTAARLGDEQLAERWSWDEEWRWYA